MEGNPASSLIEEFFSSLKIQSQYYSSSLKQPVFLIGEKDLYEAIKKVVDNC